jgi:hypothetical protein
MTTPSESEVLDALIQYADFEEADSLERAKLFQTAALRWQLMRPISSGDSGSTMAFDAAGTQAALDRCRAFIAAKTQARTVVRHLSCRGWRK